MKAIRRKIENDKGIRLRKQAERTEKRMESFQAKIDKIEADSKDKIEKAKENDGMIPVEDLTLTEYWRAWSKKSVKLYPSSKKRKTVDEVALADKAAEDILASVPEAEVAPKTTPGVSAAGSIDDVLEAMGE